MEFVGIDPGRQGFLCIYADGTHIHVPLTDTTKCIHTLSLLTEGECVAVVEHVNARPNQSISSMFQFGYNVGTIIGWLQAMRIPYHEVAPQKWQKAVWEPRDKVKTNGKTDPKKTSIRCATRLFPHIDFRRTERCKVADDNKVDATLICEYAKITYGYGKT